MADWYGVLFRRRLRSADRFSERAIVSGFELLKIRDRRSNALLFFVTRPDHFFGEAGRDVFFCGCATRVAIFFRYRFTHLKVKNIVPLMEKYVQFVTQKKIRFIISRR